MRRMEVVYLPLPVFLWVGVKNKFCSSGKGLGPGVWEARERERAVVMFVNFEIGSLRKALAHCLLGLPTAILLLRNMLRCSRNSSGLRAASSPSCSATMRFWVPLPARTTTTM